VKVAIDIIIPTLGRVDKQITLSNIPEKYHDRVYLVVQEHEYDEMCKKYTTPNIWKLPSGTNGLALTRGIIAKEWAGKRYLCADDDIQFLRIDKSTMKAKKPFLESDFDDMINQVEQKMDEGYVHGGLSFHNTPPQENEFNECGRMWTNVFYSEKLPVDDITWHVDNKQCAQDFYVNLQLLTKGYPSIIFNHFRVNASATNAPGGVELYRTIEWHNKWQQFLADQFPRYVEVYEKVQASGPWKGLPKKAVKIKWKKAYEDNKKVESTLEDFFS
jgi:hypothetical protein